MSLDFFKFPKGLAIILKYDFVLVVPELNNP